MVEPFICQVVPHIEVIPQRPASHIPAATDGVSTIWVDPELTQVEYRCVLAHELVHIGYGHTSCQPPSVEARVRALTAKFLIPFDELVESWRWAATRRELADELQVTWWVLEDRIEGLTEDERNQLASINIEVGKTL